jgi:8-oxo-dGTP diphosphatase
MAIQVTVHLVVFTVRDSALKVLLVQRGRTGHKNRMGILGVALRSDESFVDAAKRSLAAQLGTDQLHLEQLYCSVDPKASGESGRAFTVAYYALLPADKARGIRDGMWRTANNLRGLSPAPRRIVEQALKQLRKKVEHNTAGFFLLARKFTLPELQAMYEAVLNTRLDKRNFRKKMTSLGLLRRLPEWRRTGRKPARLYTVAASRLEKLEEKESAPSV